VTACSCTVANLDNPCPGYGGAVGIDPLAGACACACHTDLGWKPINVPLPSARYVDAGPYEPCWCRSGITCPRHR